MGKRAKRDPDDVIVLEAPKALPRGEAESGASGIRLRESFKTEPSKRLQIPLWHERWSKDALLNKLAELGGRDFDRGYRQYAISDEELMWKPEWIEQALERNYTLPTRIDTKDFWYGMRRFAGLDIAVSASEEAKFFVLAVIGVDRAAHRWLLSLERSKGLGWGGQMSAIRNSFEAYRFEVLGVESNAAQEYVAQYHREEGVIPVRSIHTGAMQKTDLSMGIPSMATEWEQGRWHIPYGDERSRRAVEPLLEELNSYPQGATSDCVMAIFFAREMHRTGPRGEPRIMSLRW